MAFISIIALIIWCISVLVILSKRHRETCKPSKELQKLIDLEERRKNELDKLIKNDQIERSKR